MKKLFLLLIAAVLGTIGVNAQQYKVGQVYSVNGVNGLVAYVDNSGQHGLLLSLEESDKDWMKDKELITKTKAFNAEDGMKNMEAIAQFIAENHLSWSDFPVFEWARNLGEGWYIPAQEELKNIWKSLNGGDMKLNKKSAKLWKAYEKTIDKRKGDSFFCRNFDTVGIYKMLTGMISSTQANGDEIYAMNTESGMNLFGNPLFSPNVEIIEYTIKVGEHHQHNRNIMSQRAMRFDTRAVHKF